MTVHFRLDKRWRETEKKCLALYFCRPPISNIKKFVIPNPVKIDDGDKQRFDDDTNQKKMILVHEKVKAKKPKDFPGMDFEEACLAKHRFVGKYTVL